MSIKTIIARFLPLLDVTVVLLGLMILLMARTRLEAESPPEEKPQIRLIYLYVHPDGNYCSRLDPKTMRQVQGKIDMNSNKDIQSILQRHPAGDITWLLLVFDENDEYRGEWTNAKRESLRKAWNLKAHQKLFDLLDAPLAPLR